MLYVMPITNTICLIFLRNSVTNALLLIPLKDCVGIFFLPNSWADDNEGGFPFHVFENNEFENANKNFLIVHFFLFLSVLSFLFIVYISDWKSQAFLRIQK